MPLILGANQLTAGGYEVDNSLRFNSGSSDSLTRSLGASPTSKRIATWSFWVKRSNLGSGVIYSNEVEDDNNRGYIQFSSDQLRMVDEGSPTELKASQVFRDVSAWYHIVVACDTTQATSTNRVKFYVNGNQISIDATTTFPSQNTDLEILTGGQTNKQHIGKVHPSSTFFNGYFSEFYFIDGQQLTPSSFGETDEDTNIWKPIPYTGTFGTNGFYLEFQNSGALGTDSSGNGNTFTVNNLTSIDQTTDTPTNNFATMNPLTSFGTVTLAEGNLQVGVPDNTANSTSTFMVSSGKWYWEVKQTVGTLAMVGIRPEGMNYNQNSLFNLTGTNQGYYYYGDSGNIRPANTAYGNSFGVADIIGVALDLDNNKLYFSKNGTFQNSGVPTSGATGTGAVSIATSGLTWGFSFTSGGNIDTIQCNFGNPPFTIASGNADGAGFGNFEYAVPAGYYSLNTKNLANFG